MKEVFTIGHSTRTVEQFVGLLKAHAIKKLVDIRTIPRSAYNPQFNKERLTKSLEDAGIAYQHSEALGGLRHAKKDSINLGWRNASFRGYADYMATPEFQNGLADLMKTARKHKTAIMCAEAVPWRCHRSLVADALTKKKWIVRHISSKQTASKHKLTPFLRMRAGKIMYPKQHGDARSGLFLAAPPVGCV